MNVSAEDTRGLWVLPRRDTCDSARCERSGNMTGAPREVRRYGGGVPYRFVNEVTVNGARHFVVRVGRGPGRLGD